MNLEQVTEFFKWMTIINIGILVVGAVMIMLMGNALGSLHGKLFGITELSASTVAYAFLGVFKIQVIIFNITPYVALLLIT